MTAGFTKMGKVSFQTNGSARTPRRNQFEIWAEVLEACFRTGRTQNWLLRRLGLKTKAIKNTLNFLSSGGLIQKETSLDRDRVMYLTTQRGADALIAYYKLVKKFFGK